MQFTLYPRLPNWHEICSHLIVTFTVTNESARRWMMQVAIALIALVFVSGHSEGELKRELMGTTAKCLYDARSASHTKFEDYRSAVNECMWAKADARRD